VGGKVLWEQDGKYTEGKLLHVVKKRPKTHLCKIKYDEKEEWVNCHYISCFNPDSAHVGNSSYEEISEPESKSKYEGF